jgi:hypothetical protein
MTDRNHDEPVDGSLDRLLNRRAAMRLAERQAQAGDPVCGAFFGFLHSIRHDPMAAFMDDFYDVDFEDDSDDARPY